MTSTHRRTSETPEENRAHIYAATEKTGRVTPTCTHGTTMWEGEMPRCGTRPCLTRWWLRWGIPAILLLAGIITVGLTVHIQGDCPPGWEWDWSGTCSKL